jgi:hypothetical protein
MSQLVHDNSGLAFGGLRKKLALHTFANFLALGSCIRRTFKIKRKIEK